MQSGVAQSLWSSTLHPLAKYLYCPLLQTVLCNYNIIHYVYAACVTKEESSPKSSCAVQADRTHSCSHFKACSMEISVHTPLNNRLSFFFFFFVLIEISPGNLTVNTSPCRRVGKIYILTEDGK